MQRDMDLVRDLLLQVDKAPKEIDSDDLLLLLEPQPPLEKFYYHLELLALEAGFLTGLRIDTLGDDGWIELKLTWAGHEFLDKIRDPAIWQETQQVAKKAGGFSLDILGALARGLLKKQIEKHTGLELEF